MAAQAWAAMASFQVALGKPRTPTHAVFYARICHDIVSFYTAATLSHTVAWDDLKYRLAMEFRKAAISPGAPRLRLHGPASRDSPAAVACKWVHEANHIACSSRLNAVAPCTPALFVGHALRTPGPPRPSLADGGPIRGGRLHCTREDSVGGSWGGEGPEEESSSDSMLARLQSRCRQPRIASLDRLAEPVISLVSPARGVLIGCLACSVQSAPDISWPCNHNLRGCACLLAQRGSVPSGNQRPRTISPILIPA